MRTQLRTNYTPYICLGASVTLIACVGFAIYSMIHTICMHKECPCTPQYTYIDETLHVKLTCCDMVERLAFTCDGDEATCIREHDTPHKRYLYNNRLTGKYDVDGYVLMMLVVMLAGLLTFFWYDVARIRARDIEYHNERVLREHAIAVESAVHHRAL